MPDTKTSSLTAYTTLHVDDLLFGVDVHDTTMAPTGTDKKLTPAQLFAALTGAITYTGFVGTIAAGAVNSTNLASGAAAANVSTLGGDLSGTLPSPTVVSINGVGLGSTTATAGNLLIGSGSQWATHAMAGDATITSGGTITIASSAITTGKIAASAVTYAKLQNESASTLLGNPTGSTAAPSEITLGSGLSFSGTTLVATGGSGTVTTISVVAANGFAGTVGTATTTPAITISTSVTGLLKGNGTAISAASAGTDYQAPITLTTTGSSGAATLAAGTLNIPVYAGVPPGGTSGQIQYNNASAFGGFTASGDATINTATGAVAVTKTGGIAFAASATTDTTSATNITSGTLPNARLVGVPNSAMANSSVTISGHVLALGGSLSLAAADVSGLAASATTDTTVATNITSGTLPAAQLPAPSSSTLGGIRSAVAVSHQWIASISTLGVPSLSQPAFSDISGNIATTQLNSGTGASSSTYWRGDGTWATPPSGTGTVTSVALTMPGVIFSGTVTGSPVTTSGTLAPALATQTANTVLAGPTTGSAATPTFRALVGADLPAPSSSTLGGVQSAATVSHQWIDSISTGGVPHLSQPAFSDISGSAAVAQLPVMVASGASHAAGIAPDPGSSSGTTHFLREDATWAVPAGGGGSPGGSTTQIQYNSAGSFGGAASLSVGASGEMIFVAMAAPGSPTIGADWLDSTQNCRAHYSGPGGIVTYRAGLIFSQVTAATVAAGGPATLISTTSAIGSVVLPAGFLNVAGRSLRITGGGYASTAASSPGSIYFLIKLGTNIIATSAGITQSAGKTTAGWTLSGIITCKLVGASGKLDISVKADISQLNSGALSAPIVNGTVANTPAPSTQITLDLAPGYTFDFQAAYPGYSSGDTITMTNFTMEVIG